VLRWYPQDRAAGLCTAAWFPDKVTPQGSFAVACRAARCSCVDLALCQSSGVSSGRLFYGHVEIGRHRPLSISCDVGTGSRLFNPVRGLLKGCRTVARRGVEAGCLAASGGPYATPRDPAHLRGICIFTFGPTVKGLALTSAFASCLSLYFVGIPELSVIAGVPRRPLNLQPRSLQPGFRGLASIKMKTQTSLLGAVQMDD